jgi:hypothetical protein
LLKLVRPIYQVSLLPLRSGGFGGELEVSVRNLIILAIGLLLAWPSLSPAEVVGHVTQVEGRVELLKGGKLPATEARAQDGVEPGDVLRSKSLSKAQITFLDKTTVTISPESRIAIEEYMFDPAQGKRRAVLQLFQGLAHFVVSQVYKLQEPDFIVKTHTAAMGVRGTDVGIRLTPNDTTFLNFQGLVRVANIFPEVGDTLKRAEKTAFGFGDAFVDLTSMQGSVVARGLPPTLPFTLTDQDRQLFDRGMQYGPQGRSGGSGYSGPGSSDLTGNLPKAVNPAVTNLQAQIMNDLTITPRLAAAATTPTDPGVTPNVNFTFSQIFSGGTFNFAVLSSTTGTLSGSFTSISRTVAYPGVFTSNLLTGTATATSGFFLSGSSGSLIVSPTNNSFSVSGPQGGTLTGTGSLQASAVSGAQTTAINLSGPVSIAPTGAMTFTPAGTLTVSGGSPTASGTVTNVSATSH